MTRIRSNWVAIWSAARDCGVEGGDGLAAVVNVTSGAIAADAALTHWRSGEFPKNIPNFAGTFVSRARFVACGATQTESEVGNRSASPALAGAPRRRAQTRDRRARE
jgi:hypothetical protein